MASNTVYLITGANRGIGRAMVGDLLLRPATTVVATVRDPSLEQAQSLLTLPAATGSKIVVAQLDVKQGADGLIAQLAEKGIDRLNVVISNAGNSDSFRMVLDTDPSAVRDDFEVNAVGPLRLFQACWSLLDKVGGGSGEQKKFILITSSVGSISLLDQMDSPGVSYGMSKAAANWLGKKIKVEYTKEGLLVGIIHPGWVKTSMGQAYADSMGFPEPPMEVSESSRQVLEQIDNLSDETSGKYLYNGQELGW